WRKAGAGGDKSKEAARWPPARRNRVGSPCEGEGADRRGQHPPVPIHRGTPPLRRPQKINLSDHRMVGEEWKVQFCADHVDGRVSDAEHDREHAKLARRHHEPNPLALLAILPTRKLAQTIMAR